MNVPGNQHIVFVGGGTGGSVTPLLALIPSLRERWPDAFLSFVGTTHGPEGEMVKAAGLSFATIPCGKLRRYWSVQNVLDIGRTIAGLIVSWRLIGRLRPTLVIAAGSFVAVPFGWVAWIRRVPVVIHQQDVIPGLANRLLAPIARWVTVTFPLSQKYFPSKKTTVVGNPVRREIFHGDRQRARRQLHLRRGKLVVLILGGGTGARHLNELTVAALPKLVHRCDLIHLTGRGKMLAHAAQPGYHPIAFAIDELPDYLAVADLIVSRAGLATIAELAALSKPTLLVPLPGTHQEANAGHLAAADATRTFLESRGAAAFEESIVALLENTPVRQMLGERLRGLLPSGANERLVQIISKVIGATQRTI